MNSRWTIATGTIGGIVYVTFTWLGTLTGLLEWYQQWDPDQLRQLVAVFTPFSLLALFLLGSMLAHRYLRPKEIDRYPVHRLWMVGLGFSVGATLTQLLLLRIDGVAAPRAWLVAGLFLGSTLLVTLLTVSFYRFLSNR